MKRFVLAAVLCLLPCVVHAADPAPPAASLTVPLQVDQNDLSIYATAIRIAATQCGATNPTACQIGLNEKAQIDKLNDAGKAYQDALKAQVVTKKK